MNLFIHHPEYPNLPAHDNSVKALFGLDRKAKWPAEGMPPREIQGITCWVDPLNALDIGPTRGHPFRIRARCACPVCHKNFPIGRLHQHSKVHV